MKWADVDIQHHRRRASVSYDGFPAVEGLIIASGMSKDEHILRDDDDMIYAWPFHADVELL